MQLIVGLGNPGPEHAHTRHNAGAWLVEQLARRNACTLAADKKFIGLTGKTLIDNHAVHLLIPTTYMNRSGQAVAALANFYKIAAANILVAHDELDLDPGVVRLKIGGGHGGHNGLRSIISALGNTKDFMRLRIGIGHPGHASQVTNYVLSKPSANDLHLIEDSLNDALAALPLVAADQWQRAQTQLHSAKPASNE
ncbi:MAG: aminoacyl-tRNA hydrolase [Pseudomonadales bacterium]